jgi:integrase
MTDTPKRYELDPDAVERVWACHLDACAGERWPQHRGVAAMIRSFLDSVRCVGTSGDAHLVLDSPGVLRWLIQYARGRAVGYAASRLAILSRFLKALLQAGLVDTDLLAAYRLGCRRPSWPRLVEALQAADPPRALAILRPPLPAGPLAGHIPGYIELHQALGKKYSAQAQVLHELDRFLLLQAVSSLQAITPTLIEQWLQPMTCIAAVRRRKADYAGRFFDHLVSLQVLPHNPLSAPLLGRGRQPATAIKPFLFTREQLAALLAAAQRLPDTDQCRYRARTCYMMLVLLSALGLRHGEVCRLRIRDLHLDQRTLFIDRTKFHKSRHVPFGPKVGRCLEQFLEVRRLLLPPLREDDALFVTSWRKPVSHALLLGVFRGLLREVGITGPPGGRLPRLHDLRHRFAVYTLLRWYRAGIDVQARLPILATFLGHVRPESTGVYLTITVDLLQEAGTRFDQQFGQPAFEETNP